MTTPFKISKGLNLGGPIQKVTKDGTPDSDLVLSPKGLGNLVIESDVAGKSVAISLEELTQARVIVVPNKDGTLAFLSDIGDAGDLTGTIPTDVFALGAGNNVFLRWTGSAWEWRTAANVRSDIGANNAANLNAGILPDARLSSNIPRIDSSEIVWDGLHEFEGGARADDLWTEMIQPPSLTTRINLDQGALYPSQTGSASLDWVSRVLYGDWTFPEGLNSNNLTGTIAAQRLGWTSGNNVFLRWTGTTWQWRTAANVRSDIGANNAGNLNAGVLSDERLTSNIPRKSDAHVSWSGSHHMVSMETSGYLHVGGGADILGSLTLGNDLQVRLIGGYGDIAFEDGIGGDGGVKINFSNTNDVRELVVPDKDGTIALISDAELSSIKQTQAISKNSLSLTGGYAVIKDDPKLRPSTSSFTIAGWVKVSSGAETAGTVWGTGRAQSTYPDNVWAVTHSTALGGILQLILNGDPSSVFYRTSNNAAPPVAYDEWMHVAFSIDTVAQEVSAFVNGVLYSTEAITNGPFNLNSTNDFMIGRGLNAAGNPIGPTFEGNIGETYFLSFAADVNDVKRCMTGDIPIEWRGGIFQTNTDPVATDNLTLINPTPSGFDGTVSGDSNMNVYTQPRTAARIGDVFTVSFNLSNFSIPSGAVHVNLTSGQSELGNIAGYIEHAEGAGEKASTGRLWKVTGGGFHRITFRATQEDLLRIVIGARGQEPGDSITFGLSDLKVVKNGAVIHLDPRNIGPTQWIEPNGYHALYHDTGAFSAQELEEATLKFYAIEISALGNSSFYLGGARDIIPEGYDIVSIQYACGDIYAGNKFKISYSNGTLDEEIAEVSANLSNPIPVMIHPDNGKREGYNRIKIDAIDNADIVYNNFTFKIKRR